MNDGERRLIEYQNGMSGGFFDALFSAMFNADGDNQVKLLSAYPEEMNAVLRWRHESGYADKLLTEWENQGGL